MGLSGNAGRSRHGIKSREGAARARRVRAGGITAKERRLESLRAQRSFTLLLREEWREYKGGTADFDPLGAQATGRRSCTT